MVASSGPNVCEGKVELPEVRTRSGAWLRRRVQGELAQRILRASWRACGSLSSVGQCSTPVAPLHCTRYRASASAANSITLTTRASRLSIAPPRAARPSTPRRTARAAETAAALPLSRAPGRRALRIGTLNVHSLLEPAPLASVVRAHGPFDARSACRRRRPTATPSRGRGGLRHARRRAARRRLRPRERAARRERVTAARRGFRGRARGLVPPHLRRRDARGRRARRAAARARLHASRRVL